MQGKHWLVLISILLVSAAGCRELNEPYFCNTHPEDPVCARPPDKCGDIMCAAPEPVCDTTTTTCVECVESADCPSTRGVCSENTCVQCQVNSHCDSKLCLAGGMCADPADVTYVAEMGSSSNATCLLDAPCQNLRQALESTALRKYIKVTGIITDDALVDIVSKKAIIYGELGASLRRSPPETVLRIKGTSEVTLVDLDIQGNAAGTGKHCVEITEDAVVTMMGVNVHNHGQAGVSLAMRAKLVMLDSQVHDNTTEGVIATGGTLELRRSLIYKNQGVAGVSTMNATKVTIDSSTIAANTGSSGGVSITGPFSIKNSIISANGSLSMTSSAGGLTLNPLNAVNAEFEFNTVSDNLSASATTGISCVNVAFDVSNSIFTSVLATGNVVSNCNVKYSLTGLTGAATPTNKIGDPMFITKELLSPMFYRIGSASAARDSADPAATLDVDIDNQPRPDAQDAPKDMGADEFR